MADNIKVTSCIMCPFNYDGVCCTILEEERPDDAEFCNDKPPKCCPLRNGPQTVELDGDTKEPEYPKHGLWYGPGTSDSDT